jgi:hypothetical protein
VLLAAIVATLIATYAIASSAGGTPLALGADPSGGASTDCADTAMAAVADKSPTAAQRAYQCMDPSFQQRVPEQVFVQQMQAQALPNVQNLERVGDYHSPGGGTMVYYAVDASGRSVGYIVYLGSNGKVLRIE